MKLLAFKMSALFIGVTYECINLWVGAESAESSRVAKACWTLLFVFIDFHSIKWKLEREKKLHKNKIKILTSHSRYIVFVHYSHFGIIFTKYKKKKFKSYPKCLTVFSNVKMTHFSTTFIQLILNVLSGLKRVFWICFAHCHVVYYYNVYKWSLIFFFLFNFNPQITIELTHK